MTAGEWSSSEAVHNELIELRASTKLLLDENERLKREVSQLQDENDKVWIQLDRALKDSAEDRAELKDALNTR